MVRFGDVNVANKLCTTSRCSKAIIPIPVVDVLRSPIANTQRDEAMSRLIASFLVGLLLFGANAAHAQIRVTRVIDGDTYELSTGERVRLIGIDTPEKHVSTKLDRDAERTGRDRAAIRALGELASDHAKKLVLGRAVELEFDQANAATGHRDRYGRVLAYVWVLDRNGRRAFMANRRLIEDGYAVAYTRYPFRYMEDFRTAERLARENGRGLWGDGGMPD